LGILVAAGLVAVLLFVLLGLFGGVGGPSETPGIRAPSGEAEDWLARLGPDGLERLLVRLFTAMRCDIEQAEARQSLVDLVVRDPSPITGGRMHVRALVAGAGALVQQAEVQAALDSARGQEIVKAVVIALSPAGFSAEARAAVQATACELIDSAGLRALLARHLPEVLDTAGAGFV
jgi:Restriction endonuclease